MELSEALNNRKSTRHYIDKKVDKSLLDEMLSAANLAPSWKNSQTPRLYVATGEKSKNAEIMGKDVDPFYNAPVVLIVLADKAAPTYLYDGTLVMENLMLAAHDEGLGSCWIHRAKEEFESKEGKEILKSLGIEGDYEGIGHCVIGYVNGEYPKTSPRRENRVFYVE